VQDYRI